MVKASATSSDSSKNTGALSAPETAQVLFEYVRSILYDPAHAELSIDCIDPDFKELASGLEYLCQCADEQRRFGDHLAKGEYSVAPPSIENGLAAPLKQVQGALNHLAWQAQEVSKGDYRQHVDFMGDLGDAFNTMTAQLEERQAALIRERNSLRSANKELSAMNDLMVELALASKRSLLFIDDDTDQVVYQTDSFKQMALRLPLTTKDILENLRALPDDTRSQVVTWTKDISVRDPHDEDHAVMRFRIISRGMIYMDRPVTAHMIDDQTDQMLSKEKMADLAFHDPLTGLYNRRYGMDRASSLVDGKTAFVLGFIDLDNLKYCNDNFGHEEGDRYITSVAARLETVAKDSLVCRIGGDEFMVIWPDHDVNELTELLSAERSKVLEDELPQGYRYRHSFSYGCIAVPAQPDQPLSEYLAKADYAMYQFKYAHKKSLFIG